MTPQHDLDQQLNAFLREGPTDLPDESFDAVRDRTEQTRQRVILGPWRLPEMNKILTVGFGAAAVVVVLLVGAQFFRSPSGGVGTEATATAEPTATPAASVASPSTPPYLAGPYLILEPAEDGDAPPITITINGSDVMHRWEGAPQFGAIQYSEGIDPPDGAAMIAYSSARDMVVYEDPCDWSTTETPATTVDEVVAALAVQALRNASEPVDVSIDGYSGQSITLHVPDNMGTVEGDTHFPECDSGKFASFGYVGDPGPARNHQGPGQIDELWILDVNGAIVILDAMYGPETDSEVIDDLRTIVESAVFELP